MSATEVIEEIKQLPREEQRKVAAYVRALDTGEVSEEFKRIADEVFTTNDELFRKLAQGIWMSRNFCLLPKSCICTMTRCTVLVAQQEFASVD